MISGHLSNRVCGHIIFVFSRVSSHVIFILLSLRRATSRSLRNPSFSHGADDTRCDFCSLPDYCAFSLLVGVFDENGDIMNFPKE